MNLSPGPQSLKSHRITGAHIRRVDRALEKAIECVAARFGSKSLKPLLDAQRNIRRARHVLSVEFYRGYPLDANGNLSGLYFGD
jgi:hypothetical protein